MKSKLSVCLTILIAFALAMPALVAAETKAEGSSKPFVSRAVKSDLSPPLRDMVKNLPPVVPTGLNKEVPMGVVDRPQAPAGPSAPDPVIQTDPLPFGPPPIPTPPPIESFMGLSDDDNSAILGFRIVPPDTNGDVGPNHYFQWINSIYAIWDKSDTGSGPILGPVAGNTVFAGFGGACQTENDGDPVVLYDQLADRWQISQFAIDEGLQCIAVSKTPDPTGAYWRYAFLAAPGGGNDYPKLGVTPNSYTATYRDFAGGFNITLAVYNRAKMLVGDGSAEQVIFGLSCTGTDCIDGVLPSDLDGFLPVMRDPEVSTVREYFFGANDEGWDTVGGIDSVRVWHIDVDWASPGGATMAEEPPIAVSAFDRIFEGCGFFDCIPQPSPGERLSAFQSFTMHRAAWRIFDDHESVVLNWVTDTNDDPHAGIRWTELRKTSAEGGDWALYQEGTYAPDTDHRWTGSIAMDKKGNIALGYSVSSTSTIPSIRYTTRQEADPLGTMPGGEVELHAGTGVQTASSNRWGDYSMMTVDPVDDCTFWFTTEYYETTGGFDFNTRIGSFRFADCAENVFADDFESGDTTAW